jgi:hypothetical protein
LAYDASGARLVAGNLAAPFQQGHPPMLTTDPLPQAANICRKADATISDFRNYAV